MIIQVSKLINKINFRKNSINANKNQHISSKFENKNDVDSDIKKLTPIHEAINVDVEIEFCNTYIENKYTKIVKPKKMTLII